MSAHEVLPGNQDEASVSAAYTAVMAVDRRQILQKMLTGCSSYLSLNRAILRRST